MKTETDVEEQIMELDKRQDILQSDTEIESHLKEIQAQKNRGEASRFAPRLPKETSQKCSCYRCGRGSSRTKREAPFDEFCSRVVEEIGFGIHMVSYNHYNPENCLQVHEESSYYPLGYHPNEMTWDEAMNRSWRRYIAYRLWRDEEKYARE